jgi:hypothetical protein
MMFGVMGFYFVLSDINAVVSDTVRKDIEFSARLSMLEKVQKKYDLTYDVYKEAKMSLYEDEFKTPTLDLKSFYSKFPTFLRVDLKFRVNSIKLKNFPIFKNLDRSIVNILGQCLVETVIEPSTFLYLLFTHILP